jgi:predicted CopG family antitoxin
VSFKTINIDDVAYEKFNNVSFYDIIRDKLFENNMLSSILME